MDRLRRLQQLEASFQHQLEAEKLEAMAEFAAGAGHEINNPLTVISGRAQLLLRGEVDPERRHDLALIHAQALRVHEMIADMMLFARPPQPVLAPLAVAAFLRELCNELAPAARERGIALRMALAPGEPTISADARQLQVALRALIDNAFQALGDHGEVVVSLEMPLDDWARISVSDNGPGFSPQDRRHLFDPFYSGRSAGRGLGMGLAKCWRIVKNHGGNVDVRSEPGQGATFTLELPLDTNPGQTCSTPDAATP